MKIYAFIFARGGSKGIKRKNMVSLGGKPLISHAIDLAKKNKQINKIFVSTDDNEIKNLSKLSKVNIISRPKYLATDKSGEWKSWQHAVNYLKKKGDEFDIFVSLPATSPFRSMNDLKKSIKLLRDTTDVVVTISKANRNPWFNMVKENKQGFLQVLNKSNKKINRIQDAPQVYDLTTVAYVLRPDFILKNKGIFDGKVKGLNVSKERALDIDDMFDLKIAKLLMENKID